MDDIAQRLDDFIEWVDAHSFWVWFIIGSLATVFIWSLFQ